MIELEKLYLKAKDAYYNGQPIMTDSEFDALEEKLRTNGSSVVSVVGSWDRKAKIKHPSPMRSLEKIQANKTTGEPPADEFVKWLNNITTKFGLSEVRLLFEQKLDGNAINLVYENGVLKHALSRGDGTYGRDYISKIDLSKVPQTLIIGMETTIEIRCEAVISKKVFDEKYADKFSNERNYVAGVLNSDDSTDEQRSEIDIVPVDMREITNDGKIRYRNIFDIQYLGFKNFNELQQSSVFFNGNVKENLKVFNDFFTAYEEFKRDKSKYRVDGMVVKIKDGLLREKVGEVEHHPLWALAVKFKPEDCVTEIVGFEMNMGKTGVFTPVALLKPVDLDGSVVSKASAYNYAFIRDNRLNVGSIVSLVKSGDIIPQIINVVSPSKTPFDVLSNFSCPYCDSPLEIINEKHIHCSNPSCDGVGLQRFINSMSALKLYGLGPSMMEELYRKAYESPESYLIQARKTIEEKLEEGGLTGKVWDNFVDELFKLQELTIEQVIALESYDGISNDGKTIKEIGKKLSGCDYTFAGLEKSVVSGWDPGEAKHEHIIYIVKKIETFGRKVVFHEKKEGHILKLTLTGSPKAYGFKTKADYINQLVLNGYTVEEVPVKDCDYLVTDDLDSTSSKMMTAKKLGKSVITYQNTNIPLS